MTPKIQSGQLCTLQPLTETPRVGDVVLCTLRGRQYLHLVKAVHQGRCLIGNARGHTNGWATTVHGKCVRVER